MLAHRSSLFSLALDPRFREGWVPLVFRRGPAERGGSAGDTLYERERPFHFIPVCSFCSTWLCWFCRS